MKKKLVTGLVFSCMMLLAGCGNSSNEYVSVNQYKNLTIQVSPKTVITDEQVDAQIQSTLEANATEKKVNRKSKNGDIVVVDYVGKADGKEFEGGTAKDMKIEIGSGNYIPANGKYKGFEEQLINHKAKDKFDITCKFPDDYNVPNLKGKVTTFSITMKSVNEKIIPQCNDEWVKANSKQKTVKEYKESVKKSMQDSADQSYEQNVKNTLYKELLRQSKIKKDLPEKEINDLYDRQVEQYKSYAQNYGMDYDTFIQQYMGQSAKDVEKMLKTSAQENIQWKYTAQCIASSENIKITDKMLKKYKNLLTEQTGFSTDEEFEKAYGKDFIKDYATQEEVLNLCMKSAKIEELK